MKHAWPDYEATLRQWEAEEHRARRIGAWVDGFIFGGLALALLLMVVR